MIKNTIVSLLLLLLCGITVLGLPAAADPVGAGFKEHEVTVPLCFDYYYSYDMVVQALEKLHQAYPQLTKLEIVGKSEEGRAIHCMTVNNPKTGNSLDKPGVLVDGNIHGNEIQGSEVCLYLLDYLLAGYNNNKEITTLVDKNCFYVVPVVNPDGRYHFLAESNSRSDNRSLRRPHDDDNDGLLDEDCLDDLDGDGNICLMRKKDPNGEFKTDPEDPRLMIRVKPGEKGEWTILGEEGIDNDGDGKFNEDCEGYVDANRNWGYDWMPPYVQAGAGDYPFSGVGIKALAQHYYKLPNICLYWTFHNTGGMYLRGPSTKAFGDYPRGDVEAYDFLGKQTERITPGYRYIILWKDLYETYGDSLGWMVMMKGAFSFVGELFMVQSETFKTLKESKEKPEGGEEGQHFFHSDPTFERERIQFNDHLAHGELYRPWTPYKHPTYGDIEIGGWVKLSSRLPHPFMLKDLVHRNSAVVLFMASHTPEVRMEIIEKKKIDTALYRIRIRLANSKAIPSMSEQAIRDKIYPQDMLTCGGPGIKVRAGGKIIDIYTGQVNYKEHRPEIQFLAVPGFGKEDYQFMVSGQPGDKVTIRYDSRIAGKITRVLTLD